MPERKERPFNNLEIKRVNDAVWAVNVESLMPSGWKAQIEDVVNRRGNSVRFRGGKVKTSEELETFITAYKVVKGTDMEDCVPELWDLYHNAFREIVSKVAGEEVVVDPRRKYRLNINQMDSDTQVDGYERHWDKNHWTALLAVSTMSEGDGGELIHFLPDGTALMTRIQAGWLYIFDGKTHPHKVELLHSKEGHRLVRTTVPMDYNIKGEERAEDDDEDDMGAIFGEDNGNGWKALT